MVTDRHSQPSPSVDLAPRELWHMCRFCGEACINSRLRRKHERRKHPGRNPLVSRASLRRSG